MTILLTFAVTALILIGTVWVVKKTLNDLEDDVAYMCRGLERKIDTILKRLEDAELKVVALEKKFLSSKKSKKGDIYDA